MTDRYLFTEDSVVNAPNDAGVYALYDNNDVIYYGRATGGEVTIRSRLTDHKSGREGNCTQSATHYSHEVTSSPISREKELLEQFFRLNGRLPRCNDVMP